MKKEKIVASIEKILELTLPCEEGGSIEVLCDECPFDIVPNVDCGLAILQARARMLKLEGESGDKCPECDCPATHPSGLCRDCYQAKLEMD